jgi:hypothetical protein
MRAFLKHRVRRYLGLDSEELSGFGISSFLASNAPKYSLSQTVSVWDDEFRAELIVGNAA